MRNRVFDLAPIDPSAAHTLAKRIEDPWYRCQSLTYVAEHTKNERERGEVLDQAFAAGEQTGEPNRTVTVSTWPVAILCQSGTKDYKRLSKVVPRLLSVIAKEPHPTRRNDALFMLLRSTWKGPERTVTSIFSVFKESAVAGHGWKIDRNLRDAAILLWELERHADARDCIKLIEKPRVRRQAQRMLEDDSRP
ncbi:MAG: hypothetical protein P1V97_24230 [Planctomycetota bacterium]|nr:hypothetical protein [Planctomycetota bacterium]